MEPFTLALHLIHVLLGVFWAGTIFFLASFLLPAVRRAGPDGGKVMYHITRSRFVVVLPAAAIATILSGAALFWQTSGQMNPGWLASDEGIALSVGAAAAVVAFAIGMAVQRPATMKMASLFEQILAGGGAPTPEQSAEVARLQRRARVSLHWVAGLLLIAVVCMAAWRYV